jgi:hypothetical protein
MPKGEVGFVSTWSDEEEWEDEMEVIKMEPCKHEDDKCEYWYMGICELDDRFNVCPHDPLYKQLQEFGGGKNE